MDLIVSPMAHAPQNLALEDFYAEKGASVLLVHRDSPCLSIGMGQALDKEVDLDAAMRMGVDFVQRKTGGRRGLPRRGMPVLVVRKHLRDKTVDC